MQSFCFEIKTICGKCGNPLPINAFTEKIFCDKCGGENIISPGNWESLVAKNIEESGDFKEGEGQNSKIFAGDFEFSLLYGKQMARCPKCKTTIPEDVYNTFEEGNYKCGKCNNLIYIRKPSEFAKNIIPTAKFIVGEDTGQFSTDTKSTKKKAEGKPVLFTCPSCAANLEVDGSERMITCKYCESRVYLPDDLWFALNPAKTVTRWYVINDEGAKVEKLPKWYDLSDVAADNSGNIYVASDNGNDDTFILWSFGPDMKTRWIRKDIKFDSDHTGITVTKDGKLLLWNKNKRSLGVFSCNDGTDITTIKGNDATQENPLPFNLKGCDTLISDSDNTILALINNTFVRFYSDGSRAPLWKTVSEKGEKPGFFSRIFGGGKTDVTVPSSDSDWAPYIKEIGSKPKRAEGDYTIMNLGYDGYVYMLDTSSSDGMLAKYTRDGDQVWKKYIPLSNKECKPCADARGYVYVIGMDEKDKTKLIRFSPDGNNIDVLLNDVLDGGPLSVEEKLALAPDGTIYAFKFSEVLKVFSPDLKCIYESDKGKEEDNEKLEDNKKKKEAEE